MSRVSYLVGGAPASWFGLGMGGCLDAVVGVPVLEPSTDSCHVRQAEFEALPVAVKGGYLHLGAESAAPDHRRTGQQAQPGVYHRFSASSGGFASY